MTQTRKYKSYTVLEDGGKVICSINDYDNVHWMLAGALAWDFEQATRIMEECERTGKRLIFAYGTSDEDESGWKGLGPIEDGTVYIG